MTDSRDSSRPATDPFALLGISRRFDLDPAAVDRAYLVRAAQAHPDVPGADMDESQHVQAALNAARATLLDPERRANELLSLLAGPSKEQDKSLPPGFLVQMMETREEIEAALADPSKRRHWVGWAQKQREHYSLLVAPLFTRAVAGDANVLPSIRRELNAWRYIERLVEQLDPAYDPSRADFRA